MTTKAKILKLPHVAEIYDERDSDQGLWVFYHPGTRSSMDTVANVHQDHEDTWEELYAAAKAAIPCKCAECTDSLSQLKKGKGKWHTI